MVSPSGDAHGCSALSNPMEAHQPDNVPAQAPVANQPVDLNRTPSPNPMLSLLMDQLEEAKRDLEILESRPPTTPAEVRANLEEVRVLGERIDQIIERINECRALDEVRREEDAQERKSRLRRDGSTPLYGAASRRPELEDRPSEKDFPFSNKRIGSNSTGIGGNIGNSFFL